MPTVSGAFGEKPTLTFPEGSPPSLQRVVLSEGTGPMVESSDWLVTNYLGQIWGGEVFDNSYDRGATSTFQIGVRAVVPGWDTGLVGVPVGSRVLLSLPPADGYGSAGNSGAGIGGTDTLVFVVDIVNAIGPDQGGQADATPEPTPAGAPEISGALGARPSITIPAGLAEPTEQSVAVLARGTGAPIVDNSQVLAQYVAVDWTGESAGSTWPATEGENQTTGGTGPQQLPVQAGTPFEGLVGVPLGSRVLVTIPGQAATTGTSAQPAQPAVVAVMDLLAQ
ncbi:FKBP-type peptidyl-prolyl cis-trans isomerase [Nakamurella sp. YIM 132084]|uniref:Peptidyl-prolyl cis-trans isomerase n=2 Tax=Nakamurella leprariae TaxID=2803911 RepID=A0A938Y711_9ACTN|nr:FKBP-type peptidyl-prolyl cis-trans isomerase [Nakamurella leprariae]